MHIENRKRVITITIISTALSTLISSLIAYLITILLNVPYTIATIVPALLIPLAIAPVSSYLFAELTYKLTTIHRELITVSRIDYLTGLYNRTFFNEALQKEISHTTRNREPLSLVLFDIDNLKKINDTYGDPAGDKILQEVCQIIQSSIRLYDTIARYSEDEFALLCPLSPRRSLTLGEDNVYYLY